MRNKTAETVDRILARLWTRAFRVAQQKGEFSDDNSWKAAIAQTKKDIYTLLKLPEKKSIDEVKSKPCPYSVKITCCTMQDFSRNQTIDECNAILKTKLEVEG